MRSAARAIAAMAYGTAGVPQVDKIAGPGNLFVVLAKRAVYGVVGIEALPGYDRDAGDRRRRRRPTAGRGRPAGAGRARRGGLGDHADAQPGVAEATQAELARQLEALSRAEVPAAESIAQRGGIVLVPDLDTAFALANAYAPEHLCLLA